MKISEKHEYIDMAGRKVRVEGKRKVDGVWWFHGRQVDRAKLPFGDNRWWGSQGHSRRGVIDENIVREAEIGLTITDRQAAILERIIEAAETDSALPMRVGPKMFGSCLPESVETEDDMFQIERQEWAISGSGEGDGTPFMIKVRHDVRNSQAERRAKCSRPRIGRMEEAFEWIRAFCFDAELRTVLMAYADVKAKKWDWERFIQARNRRFPQKKAWMKRTLYRWIEKALQQVDEGLSKNDLLLRDGAGLQLAHREAKDRGKSITSDLHAWSQPDEIPAKCG